MLWFSDNNHLEVSLLILRSLIWLITKWIKVSQSILTQHNMLHILIGEWFIITLPVLSNIIFYLIILNHIIFNLMYVSFWFSCFVWSELIMLCFQQRYCHLIFNLICCGKINNWGKEGGAVICVLKKSITWNVNYNIRS